MPPAITRPAAIPAENFIIKVSAEVDGEAIPDRLMPEGWSQRQGDAQKSPGPIGEEEIPAENQTMIPNQVHAQFPGWVDADPDRLGQRRKGQEEGKNQEQQPAGSHGTFQ